MRNPNTFKLTNYKEEEGAQGVPNRTEKLHFGFHKFTCFYYFIFFTLFYFVLFYFVLFNFVDNFLPKNRIGMQNNACSQLSVLDDFVVKISLCPIYNTELNSG